MKWVKMGLSMYYYHRIVEFYVEKSVLWWRDQGQVPEAGRLRIFEVKLPWTVRKTAGKWSQVLLSFEVDGRDDSTSQALQLKKNEALLETREFEDVSILD